MSLYATTIVEEKEESIYRSYTNEFGYDLEEVPLPENAYYTILISESDENYFIDEDEDSILNRLDSIDYVIDYEHWSEPTIVIVFDSYYDMSWAQGELETFLGKEKDKSMD